MGLGRARTERRARRGLAARFGATGRDTIAARAEDMTAERMRDIVHALETDVAQP